MNKIFAVLGIALAAMTYAAPSYSADTKADKDKKAEQQAAKAQEKAAKEQTKSAKEAAKQAKKDAKALAKRMQKEAKAAKRAAKEAAKLAKKQSKKPEAHAVPEIDRSHAALAIALLAGAVAISRERRRRIA